MKLLPTYLADARAAQPLYHPIDAPNGALQLGVAENYMMQEHLTTELTKLQQNINFDASQIYYQPTQGRVGTRRAMTRLFNRILTRKYNFDENCMIIGAGCNAVLENLAICLAEAGDSVLIPTPYYAAFEFDLVARAGLKIQPVTTLDHNNEYEHVNNVSAKASSTTEVPVHMYYPNKSALDAAYEQSVIEHGSTPRILLLSSPNNPLGVCYPAHVIQECVDWAEERGVHVISDEIYAGSVYRTPRNSDDDNDNNDIVPWTSIAELAASNDQKLGPHVHIVYAMSKDFALSGLRVGAVYTENEDIAVPLQKLNDLCQISSQTQVMVEHMLDPELNGGWADTFLVESQEHLKRRCGEVEQCLEELGIPFLAGGAGLFLWMDFQEFLPELDGADEDGGQEVQAQRERALYLELLHEHGLLFTPGLSMKTELPGFFRFVFTAATEDEFQVALDRIRVFAKSKRSKN